MPAVQADPEKLRDLSRACVTAADQLQQVARSLARALETSGWNDAERQKFEQDFRQTLKSLSAFTDKLKGEYSPGLLKKATALEHYRGR